MKESGKVCKRLWHLQQAGVESILQAVGDVQCSVNATNDVLEGPERRYRDAQQVWGVHTSLTPDSWSAHAWTPPILTITAVSGQVVKEWEGKEICYGNVELKYVYKHSKMRSWRLNSYVEVQDKVIHRQEVIAAADSQDKENTSLPRELWESSVMAKTLQEIFDNAWCLPAPDYLEGFSKVATKVVKNADL